METCKLINYNLYENFDGPLAIDDLIKLIMIGKFQTKSSVLKSPLENVPKVLVWQNMACTLCEGSRLKALGLGPFSLF